MHQRRWSSRTLHRLRNRHGPMVAQRCLRAKTNSPRNFALVSCFELPKRTQNELCFGLILFEMTSYQFVLRFNLKYIGAFMLLCFPSQAPEANIKREAAFADNCGPCSYPSQLSTSFKITIFSFHCNITAHPIKSCCLGATSSGSQHPNTDPGRCGQGRRKGGKS